MRSILLLLIAGLTSTFTYSQTAKDWYWPKENFNKITFYMPDGNTGKPTEATSIMYYTQNGYYDKNNHPIYTDYEVTYIKLMNNEPGMVNKITVVFTSNEVKIKKDVNQLVEGNKEMKNYMPEQTIFKLPQRGHSANWTYNNSKYISSWTTIFSDGIKIDAIKVIEYTPRWGGGIAKYYVKDYGLVLTVANSDQSSHIIDQFYERIFDETLYTDDLSKNNMFNYLKTDTVINEPGFKFGANFSIKKPDHGEFIPKSTKQNKSGKATLQQDPQYRESINKVIITEMPQVVPPGKRWVLFTGKETTIQISDGTLNSGTFCNAMFLSNPHMIFNINKGNYSNPEAYGIIFKDPAKVPYTNDYTYNITPISITDKNFSLNDLQYKSPETAGSREIDFNEGESVYVSNCLESIELTEIVVVRNNKKTFGNQNAVYTSPGNKAKPNGSTLTNNYNAKALSDSKEVGNQGIRTGFIEGKNNIYTAVEQSPEFPGGSNALNQFINNSIKYSDEMQKANINGRVLITFIVEEDGSISNIKVLRNLGFGTSDEAKRIISISPRWSPGLMNNKPVRVQITMSINFQNPMQ